MLQRKSLCLWMVLLLNMSLLLLTVGCDMNSMDKQKIEPEKAAQWLQGFMGNLKPQKKMVLGYYENPWAGTSEITGSFPSLKANGKNLTAVGPFWYRVAKDGSLENKANQEALDYARQLGLKVYPLVTNIREATDEILGNPAVRTKATDNLVQLVKDKNYDGINIDFELLPPTHRDNLTAFMTELYPKLKAMNKTVIISVFPQVEISEDVSGAYDYAALANYTDYLQIMTYDNHWSTSSPGAIAPIDWYEKNVKYAVDTCGADKILAGVSLYGYNWDANNKGETIFYPDSVVLAEQNGSTIEYDEKVQAPHFKYDGHEVWFENARSVEAKLNVVQKYDVAGIAMWRLGQEDPAVWQKISQFYPKS